MMRIDNDRMWTNHGATNNRRRLARCKWNWNWRFQLLNSSSYILWLYCLSTAAVRFQQTPHQCSTYEINRANEHWELVSRVEVSQNREPSNIFKSLSINWKTLECAIDARDMNSNLPSEISERLRMKIYYSRWFPYRIM